MPIKTVSGDDVYTNFNVPLDIQCFCNKDFTVDELKKIVLMFRDKSSGESITDLWTGYNKNGPCSINDKSWESFTNEMNKMMKKYSINP